VLLPREPDDDLIAYLQSIPVRLVYRENDGWASIGLRHTAAGLLIRLRAPIRRT
jgi:hypothetical protein